MRWRFYLINRNNLKTRIEEPGGWESLVIKIKRHPERHGTFREVTNNAFQFTDIGMELLKAEHKTYGIRGKYTFIIQGKCGGIWQEEYRGQVAFDSYRFVCGDYCYVTVQVDQVGPLVDFLNRFDQKVDLTNPLAFDGTTALTNYPGLNKTVVLAPKTLLFRGISSNTTSQEFIASQDSGWLTGDARYVVLGTDIQGTLAVPFQNTTEAAIKRYTPQPGNDFTTAYNTEYVPEIIFNDPVVGNNPIDNIFSVSFRVKGAFKNLVANGSGSHTVTFTLKKGTTNYYSATNISTWTIYNSTNAIHTTPFDIIYSSSITLLPGEFLWFNFFVTYRKGSNFSEDVRIVIDPETYFHAEVESVYPSTPAKLSLINETTSRVIEAITNNQLKLKSDYYGRVDSLPFNSLADGCGSLRALTTGLDIRRAKLADGSDPKMFLSMKDIFESLNAVDNIGLGQDGIDKIRIENWQYFYQDTVVFTCRGIEKLENKTEPSDHYSIFRTGYDKWESEDFNGLDEFLTRREFRTELSNVQNTLERICKFIASGYAWEVTRRKANDTKDWRYDDETFIVCLVNYFKGSGNFTTGTDSFNVITDGELFAIGDQIQITNTPSNNGTYTILNVVPISNSYQIYLSSSLVTEVAPNAIFKNLTNPIFRIEMGNISSPANILDPATVYNFRISPERNALRWFNKITSCYKNITTADQLIFTSGDGNYKAEGRLTETFCRLEAAVLSESGNIDLTTFDDINDGMPILQPERVIFQFPISLTEYNIIKANQYGLIEYISKCERGFGWIDEITYRPEEGQANFSLIPKVTP